MKKVKDISTGYGFSLFAVKSGKNEGHVYGTGLNGMGQIGHHEPVKGQPFKTVIKPLPLQLPSKVTIPENSNYK